MKNLSHNLLLSVLLLFIPASLAVASPPPPVCEIALAAWCIQVGPTEITFRYSPSEEYQGVWTIRGIDQPERPLLVREPRGCRAALSDTLQLLGRQKNYAVDGKIYDAIHARLKKDGTCDLELLVPQGAIEKLDEAFSSGFAWLQSCNALPCAGESLGRFRAALQP